MVWFNDWRQGDRNQQKPGCDLAFITEGKKVFAKVGYKVPTISPGLCHILWRG